jgi:hypothetical protein
VHLGHLVEVVIGDGHILCIAGNVDDLQGQTTPAPVPSARSALHTSPGSPPCLPVTLHSAQ